VRKALSSSAAGGGDVLVFLPGVAEIRRTQRLLQEEGFVRSAGVAVQQLHGGLAPQQQDEVIRWVCADECKGFGTEGACQHWEDGVRSQQYTCTCALHNRTEVLQGLNKQHVPLWH
jgi:hypothetical protein